MLSISLAPHSPPVFGYVLGIGGRDIRVDTVLEVAADLLERDRPERCLYVGVKGLPIGPARSDTRPGALAPLEETTP